MKGGELVVEALTRVGCTLVFGIPGTHNMEIYDAIFKQKKPRQILVKQEGNGAVMADVYGRLSEEAGVCLTTAGPGATNCVTAVAQAFAAASPLLHISATVPIGAPRESLHGADDEDFLRKVFQPVTKWSVRVNRVEEVATTLFEAHRVATSGRKGPVHVSIPQNVLASWFEGELLSPKLKEEKKVEIEEAIAKRLIRAERLVIYARKNVLRHRCEGELLELSEVLNASIVVPRIALSIVPHDHELYAGFIDPLRLSHPAAKYAFDSADMILSIGVRLGAAEAEPLRTSKPKGCIHIDVEEVSEPSGYAVSSSVVEDLKEAVKQLVDKLNGLPRRKKNHRFLDEIARLKKNVWDTVSKEVRLNQDKKPIHPGVAIKILRSVLDRDAIVTSNVGNSSFWVRDAYDVLTPNGLIGPEPYASMGFSLPAAIGAKLAQPDRQVLAVMGDGGLLMSYADLPTVLENRLKLTMVVLNDSKYSAIWHIQRSSFQGRFIATDLQETDFAAIFKAFGGKGVRVEEPQELKAALEEALDSPSATLIDVRTDFSKGSLADSIYVRAK